MLDAKPKRPPRPRSETRPQGAKTPAKQPQSNSSLPTAAATAGKMADTPHTNTSISKSAETEAISTDRTDENGQHVFTVTKTSILVEPNKEV